jgi:hypothetical protein
MVATAVTARISRLPDMPANFGAAMVIFLGGEHLVGRSDALEQGKLTQRKVLLERTEKSE